MHALVFTATCCSPGMNWERTSLPEPSKKGLVFNENGAEGAAGVVAVGRGHLHGRGLRLAKSLLTAPRPRGCVAAHPPVDLIKLSSELRRSSLKARLTYSSSKVRARCSCANRFPPQARSRRAHRWRPTLSLHAASTLGSGFTRC